MNNDQIMKRIIDLFNNGETVEKVLAIEALSAIVKSLESIPNQEVYDTLAAGYMYGRDNDHIRIADAAANALTYSMYPKWMTYGKAQPESEANTHA